MNILLLDDEPFALKLLSHQLDNLGFQQVILHEYALSALALLEKNIDDIHLIFCDLQMPEMDGIEFLRKLAHLDYKGDVVLVSGEDRRILQIAETLAKAHKLNVLGSLQKPVSVDQLQSLMTRELSRAVMTPRPALIVYEKDELWRAIAGAELINHYQPKVRLATGEVTGVEALVRWKHPKDGLVFPDQFVRTAEEHGLIEDLTRVVLTTALKQLRHWQDNGLDLQVAVNISMDNLAEVGFPDYVARTMAHIGVPVANLMLEVTESQLMSKTLAPLDNITRLRLKRIGLSIDDFGTGHSSLAQLRDIPFDELKMDKGFVHAAWRQPALKAIIEASYNMAHQLGISTVGEGVEDREDWDFLREIGCDLAQGYFIARPMPGADIPAWIENWKERYTSLA